MSRLKDDRWMSGWRPHDKKRQTRMTRQAVERRPRKKHWRDIICHGTACWYIRPCTRYWACPIMIIIIIMKFLLIRFTYIASFKLFLNYIRHCSGFLIYICSTVPVEISSFICRSSKLCYNIPPSASCNPSSKICFVIPCFATPSLIFVSQHSLVIRHIASMVPQCPYISQNKGYVPRIGTRVRIGESA